jgi:two-component system, OmpR family, alkaline phosphatase synthesis response regulator PhoP
MRVLIVEDNRDLAYGLAINLEAEGYTVVSVPSGYDALAQMAEFSPDLIILDLLLPEMDGFEVLEHLQADGRKIPTIVLTALADEVSRLKVFGLGAVDYVSKPFSVLELLQRVRLRINQGEVSTRQSGVRMIPERQTVLAGGCHISLSPKEYALLAQLMKHPDRIQTRKELLESVWRVRASIATKTVDYHIKCLRDKLRPYNAAGHIVTVARRGFMWCTDPRRDHSF